MSSLSLFVKIRKIDISYSLAAVLLLAAAIRVATAIFNIGYLAIDDYYLLYNSVPAQLAESIEKSHGPLIDMEGHRLPAIEMTIHELARVAYRAGLEDPANQIRFIYLILGLFSLLTVVYAWKLFYRIGRQELAIPAALVVSFHFIMPFVATRTLIESMSMPFVLMSAFYLTDYHLAGRKGSLAFAVFWLGVGSLFRYQDGVMFLAIPVIVYLRKAYKDLFVLAGAAIVTIILTGLPDWIIRGELHQSLILYIKFNLQKASHYGVSPFYAYLPAILVVTFLPLFISRFKQFAWKKVYASLLPVILYLALFIAIHSLIPHKEERFLLPVLPLMLLVLLPAAYFLIHERKERWRLYAAIALNAMLLIPLTFFTMQNNVIGLMRYIYRNKDVRSVVVYADSLENAPISYSYRTGLDSYRVLLPGTQMRKADESCSQIFVVRNDYMSQASADTIGMKEVAVYRGNPLESILARTNPSKNRRRMAIHVFLPDYCPQPKGWNGTIGGRKLMTGR